MNATAEMQWRSPFYRSVSSLSVASDFPQAWLASGWPTTHPMIINELSKLTGLGPSGSPNGDA